MTDYKFKKELCSNYKDYTIKIYGSECGKFKLHAIKKGRFFHQIFFRNERRLNNFLKSSKVDLDYLGCEVLSLINIIGFNKAESKYQYKSSANIYKVTYLEWQKEKEFKGF